MVDWRVRKGVRGRTTASLPPICSGPSFYYTWLSATSGCGTLSSTVPTVITPSTHSLITLPFHHHLTPYLSLYPIPTPLLTYQSCPYNLLQSCPYDLHATCHFHPRSLPAMPLTLLCLGHWRYSQLFISSPYSFLSGFFSLLEGEMQLAVRTVNKQNLLGWMDST